MTMILRITLLTLALLTQGCSSRPSPPPTTTWVGAPRDVHPLDIWDEYDLWERDCEGKMP